MASTIISASGVSPQNAISTCRPFKPRIPLKCSRNCSLPLKYRGLRSPEKLLISRASGVYWLSIPSISFLRIRSICSRYRRPSGLSGTSFSTRCVAASGIRFSSRLQFGRARVIVETIDGIQRDFEAASAIGTPDLPCLVRVQFDSRRSGGWGIPYTGLPLHHDVHFCLVPSDFRRALFDGVNFVKEDTDDALIPAFKASPTLGCRFREFHHQIVVGQERKDLDHGRVNIELTVPLGGEI